MTDLQNNLPPGWDCRFDDTSGRYYYINHYTKTTTWDDPRNRYRQFHAFPSPRPAGECIQLQHGSPELRRNYVYPSHTSPIPAFQMPAHMSPKSIPLQDMKPRMSPLSVKSSRVMDTSLTLTDSEEAVSKISALFPTVSETHIKLLLKNCRYMKSVFPQADETIILEVLQNNENNIQKTSETLNGMGFEKKDTVKVAQQKMEAKMEQKREEEKIEVEKVVVPQIKLRTAEEKKNMKNDLQEKYKDVAEHLICIALESVNFDEDKAGNLLQAMIKEDSEHNSNGSTQSTSDSTDAPSTSAEVSGNTQLPISQSRQSLKSLIKSEKEIDKATFSRVVEECENGYKSSNLSNTNGPRPERAKGANENLLLENYLKWQGANPSLNKGPQGRAKGPNPDILSNRGYQSCGANKDLVKGPKFGLAKGSSIFSQLRVAAVGNGRGK